VCKPLLAQSLDLVCHVGKSVMEVAVNASEPGLVVVQLSLVFREDGGQEVVECNKDGAMRSGQHTMASDLVLPPEGYPY
jgi:dTDP-4-dehydrorhamnose reductase